MTHVEDYDSDREQDEQYFESYGDEAVHHLMLADAPRMHFYADALRRADLRGKAVIDCGAGSGALSLFALMAGAEHVFAIEASERIASTIRTAAARNAEHIAKQLNSNITAEDVLARLHIHVGMAESFDIDAHFVKVINGRRRQRDATAESSPIRVVLVSEWMGFYLLHEAMLQSVLHVRDRLRRAPGIAEVQMIPDRAAMFAAPFDLQRQFRHGVRPKWQFHAGLDMSHLGEIGMREKFSASRNPVIETVSAASLLLPPVRCLDLDLTAVTEAELETVEFTAQFPFPADFTLVADDAVGTKDKFPVLNGFVLWFSVSFLGEECILSTGPADEPTHWKQTVVLVSDEGIGTADIAGAQMLAKFTLQRDERTYQIDLELE